MSAVTTKEAPLVGASAPPVPIPGQLTALDLFEPFDERELSHGSPEEVSSRG